MDATSTAALLDYQHWTTGLLLLIAALLTLDFIRRALVAKLNYDRYYG